MCEWKTIKTFKLTIIEEVAKCLRSNDKVYEKCLEKRSEFVIKDIGTRNIP